MPQISRVCRTVKGDDRKELDRQLADAGFSYSQILEWLSEHGYTIDRETLARYAVTMGFRKRKRFRVTLVDRMLKPEDEQPYEELLKKPGTSVRIAHAWLQERGYDFGPDAVVSHRRRFLEKLDTVRASAALADAIIQVARENGSTAMSDGMLTRLEQVLLEQLMNAPLEERIAPKDLVELSKSVAGAIGSRETFESMRREFAEAKQRATAVGQAAADAGENGKAVVERMKEILGV